MTAEITGVALQQQRAVVERGIALFTKSLSPDLSYPVGVGGGGTNTVWMSLSFQYRPSAENGISSSHLLPNCPEEFFHSRD